MAVQQEHPRRKLWQSLSDQGKYTKTYEEFHQQFSTPEKIDRLYKALNEDGSYTKSYEDFDNQFFDGLGKPTGVSAPGSADTSVTSVEPMQNIQQPEGGILGQNEPSLEPSSPVNIAPQIAQANQIASEYGAEGESFDIEVPEGYELIQGELDQSGQLLDPYLRNIETGEMSNIVPTATAPAMTREQALEQNARIAQEEELEDKGILSDMYNSLQTGLTQFNASLADIPEYLLRIGAVPQNLLADAIENNAGEGTAEWLRSRYENVENGVYNPLRILSDYSKGQRENSEQYAQQITQFENDITGSIGEGNLGDAGRQVLNAIIQSAPAMVGMVATSGAGTAANLGNVGRTALNALPFAAGAYQDIENEDMPENLKLVASGLKGLSEVVFEQEFGTLPIIEGIINKSIGREAVKDFAEGYMQRLMNTNNIPASAFRGSISEGATELSNNIIAKYSGENPGQDLWEGVVDAMIVGGVMDAGLSGLSNVSDRIHDRSLRDQAKELETQISDIQSDMQNVSGREAQILQSSLDGRVQQLNAIIDQDAETTPPLTVDEQRQLDAISQRESQLNQMIESGGISEGTRAALESEVEGLEESRNDVMEEASVNRTGVTISDALIPENQSVFLFEGERGDIRLDGQTVVFENPDRILELGNVDQLTNDDLSMFGIEVESPLDISVSDNNSVSIAGSTFINPNDNPMDAINYDSNGEITSVTLQNENGRPRTIRGQRAQEIAYQYTLKNFEQNATETDIESAIQEAESLLGTEQTIEQVESAATDAGIIQEPQTEGVVNETQQPSVESTEIPMEGGQVAPVGEPGTAAQELVTETPIQDETITERPVVTDQATGLQDQNVDAQPEQVAGVIEVEPISEPIPQTETNDIQAESTIQENEQAPVRGEEVQESTTSETAPRPTRQAIQRVSERLAATGLAPSVEMRNSAQITESTGVEGSNVNGYVDNDGNIIINAERAGLDTPIHEFAHVWEQTTERENPELHARGMELIQAPDGNPYVNHVRQTQPSLEGSALYKEALAQAIGDRGARLIGDRGKSPLKKWLEDAWKYIANMAGISGMTADQVSNLTLNEYADAVAVDLLSGKPYAKLPNGDMVVETSASSVSQMDASEKFMNDFMKRMKQRNGINFQGNIDGSLSPEDFSDLITYFRHATDRGLIDGVVDARKLATDMGINSPGEVDAAYKLSKVQAKDSTGFKKAEVSAATLKRTNFEKISDKQYREIGKQLVDDGIVVPETLIADIIEEPRALQPWEVTALQYYRTQIESEIGSAASLIESGNQSNIDAYTYRMGDETLSGYKAISAKMEMVNARQFDLEVAMLTTASQQSAAFRLRSLMSDKDFNIVQYLAEMKARGYVDPVLEQRLKDLSGELNVVRAKLKEKSAEAERLAEQIAQGNITLDASRPERTTRKVRTNRDVVDAVNLVLDGLDISSFGNAEMRFQTNNTLRFQTSRNTPLSEAVSNAINDMRANISEGNLSVSDAIESAILSINESVGEGNWNAMKFRSEIANQLVGQSIPLKVKKPYVNSDGVLIIPGEYLKTIVREGDDTIDKMVIRASNDLGGSFVDYDIRNAISGYGRESGSHRSDLDRKISKARRVAKLLSQVEDLETKGKRLKTFKQVHDNDTEINNLREQIKQLEYDLEMTPEERAQFTEQRYNEQRRKYLQNYIEQVQDRISNKEFAPVKHQNKYQDDEETKALRAETERIKNEFKKEKYRHELENRTRLEKWRALAYDVIFNITRGLSAGADASAIGVQGAIFSAARPRQAYRVVAGSLPGTFSEANYEQYFSDLQADPLFEVARKSGLNLQLPSFYQSVQEEQYKGQLPELLFNKLITEPAAWGVAKISGTDVGRAQEVARDKANVFTLGDRNYSLVLSQIRMDLFREFITNQQNKQGLDVELDSDTVKQVAEIVNTITMASKVPVLQGKAANDITSAIFFSARKLVATWKILGAWAPLLAGPNKNYQLFKDAYGGIIGKGLGTMFLMGAIPSALSYLTYDEEEDEEPPYFYNPYFLNPKHSDFLKLKMGNTRVSFFQGIDGNVVFANRFLTGEYMTSSSKEVRPLNGEGFNKSRLELSWDYISNKFSPTTGIATNVLKGDRERQEAYGRFQESMAPMWLSGIKEQYENTGNTLETSSLAVLGIFGLAYNNYGGAEFAQGRGTNNKKAQEIFKKSGLAAYDPAEGQRTYWNGENVVKVTDSYIGGKIYSDKYLPAYQQFMTEATLSKQERLSPSVNWETKEGVVKEMKREAYKYAEVKTAGIQANTNFAKFSDDGTQYRLLKSQYPIKEKYVKEYMDKQSGRDRREARRDVVQKLRDDRIKATDGYRDMLVELNLYNRANKYANERLLRDMRRRKIDLVKQSDYNSDMEVQDEE